MPPSPERDNGNGARPKPAAVRSNPTQFGPSFRDAFGWRFSRPDSGQFIAPSQQLTTKSSAVSGQVSDADAADRASKSKNGKNSNQLDSFPSPVSHPSPYLTSDTLLWGYTTSLIGDWRFGTRGPKAGKLRAKQTTGERALDFIPMERCVELIAAFIHAERIGCPLNAHITLTLDGSGIHMPDADRAASIREDVLKCLGDHLRDEKHPIAFIWVMETAQLGLHLHILLHVDPTRWLEIKASIARRLLGRLTDHGVKPRWSTTRARRFEVLKITPPQEVGRDEPADLENRLRLLGYVLKGVDPLALIEIGSAYVLMSDLLSFYLGSDISSQGRILTTRRANRSDSIGPKARGDLQISALGWVDEINTLREPRMQLPEPEAIVALLGPDAHLVRLAELPVRHERLKDLRNTIRRQRRLDDIRDRVSAGFAKLAA